MTAEQFDIVIVGGGLVGTCCVSAIRAIEAQLNTAINQSATEQKPLKIAIVEAQNIDPQSYHTVSNSFDSKAIALSYGSARLLQKWGVWPRLKNQVEPITKIEVSEQYSAGFSFIHKPEHQSALGFVVEAQQIGQAMLSHIAQYNIQWFCAAQVDNIKQTKDYAELELNTGESLQAKLILACDGANSRIRELLNLSGQTDDYDQWALTTNVEVDREHNNIAYERFTSQGPLAMLPMKSNRFGLVGCAQQQTIEQLMAKNDAELIATLQQSAGYKAGKIVRIGERQMYPLSRRFSQQNLHHRVVVLGNASHTVHPIAGQGFNLGIRDVAAVAAQILNKLTKAQDIGLNWQSYQTERNTDIRLILQATDTLVRTFSNNQPILKLARNAGLLALELNPLIKQVFTQRAMGFLNNK
ncbi:FAD-dependent monooxygenase [Catenovulum sp. 2E275]|uniref:FAD-dependent monooxygenase n=1 Tax=Catenovulum sp. 2E275 TaxID=2980497 RepID=UPI0021D05DF3|nr:FAD-dependent monooxygenase [Catenovulum sp. 2E275]MCU4674321.1 FAD-dependent monooxygenase [Catenovulum sp. 2E275]